MLIRPSEASSRKVRLSDRKLACSLSEVTSVVRLVRWCRASTCAVSCNRLRAGEEAQHAAGADRRIADLGEQRLRSADAGQQRGQPRRPECAAASMLAWKMCDGDLLDLAADVLELVGEPVDDRVEQPDEHRRRVAHQLGLAPRMLGEGAHRLRRRVADGDQPVVGQDEADRGGRRAARPRRRTATLTVM